MRLFITSYLVSVSAIIMASLPAVKEAPLDIIPRICIYFGFPSAILLSVLVIAITSLLGKSANDTYPKPMTKPDTQSKNLDELKVA